MTASLRMTFSLGDKDVTCVTEWGSFQACNFYDVYWKAIAARPPGFKREAAVGIQEDSEDKKKRT